MRHGRRVTPGADRPVYKQVADDLRNQIATGDLTAGERLPGELRLGREYGVGVNSIRSALAILRAEGLVVTERAVGSRVRCLQEPLVVDFPPTARAEIRAATDDERVRLGLRAGALVIEIVDGGEIRVLPALGTIIAGSDARAEDV